MTAFRLISLPVHGALEMAAGLAMMAAPFLLGFQVAGTVVAVVIGALVVGLALNTTATEHSSVPVSAHYAADQGLVLGLLGAALLLGIDGDRAAALFFAAIALVQVALNVTTRYSARA